MVTDSFYTFPESIGRAGPGTRDRQPRFRRWDGGRLVFSQPVLRLSSFILSLFLPTLPVETADFGFEESNQGKSAPLPLRVCQKPAAVGQGQPESFSTTRWSDNPWPMTSASSQLVAQPGKPQHDGPKWRTRTSRVPPMLYTRPTDKRLLICFLRQGLRPPKVRFRPRRRPAGPDTGETRANGALLRLSFANTHSSTPRRPAHFELAISLLVTPLALWPQTPPAMGSSDLD
ncbi:hypothetical protein CPAR01_01217 [Colletotrichum paranaense]|uniref:Uncharacterized protein n=1 Tax=Colletotrichum paranaense TaxID=1914294 RepID=A0ABQ9T6G6_9PEZI|nr:uncharacterized protein CPAR01_01217 [Colletotrichum paranaense]KAK1547250.1 hypothetical protein CPAR01_01217 [Colletotrichum paranaense]